MYQGKNKRQNFNIEIALTELRSKEIKDISAVTTGIGLVVDDNIAW